MDEYNEALNKCLQEHLRMLETKIIGKANEIAETNSEEKNVKHLYEALREYTANNRSESSVKNGILNSLSSFTKVTTLLAVVFGALGLIAFYLGQENSQGFLDIAKIFAGAIVGSASKDVLDKRNN